eukprot:TRINITY_DN5396_c0_g1_i1.p1 TRINITY_DN5396_c0_g1~~TRINITY_DN5396_c0_g1_i1.p1  ORF type:complete len:272 (-),score=60.52 TRINITY_DN5396_c0_g1_i1:38-769(-)
MDKDTYQQLGLPAKKALYPKKGNRWIHKVDVKDASFVPGRNGFERTKWALTGRVSPVELLLKCDQDDNKPFTFPPGLEAKRLNLKVHVRECALPLPAFQLRTLQEQLAEADSRMPDYAEDTYTYIGAVHNRLGPFFDADPSGGAFGISEQLEAVEGAARSITFKGLLSPGFVQRKVELLRKTVKENGLPWAFLTVWGFEDAAVSWGESEHSVLYSGENDYTILLFPDDSYLVFASLGAYDAFS